MNFAEYLSEYMKKKSLTWKKASDLCGIERSLLMRYARGEKIPQKIDRVLQIAEGLSMEELEKEKLLELYEYEKIGYQQYYVNKYMDRHIKGGVKKNISKVSGLSLKLQDFPKEKTLYLDSKTRVQECLYHIICYDSNLRFMISDVQNMLPLFWNIFKEKQGNVQVILELNRKSLNSWNLNKIDDMIDVLMNWEESLLSAIYVSENSNTINKKIQLCLSDNEVLVFDSELLQGYYSREENQVLLYKKIFAQQEKRGIRIGYGREMTEEEKCNNQEESVAYWYQLMKDPCLEHENKIQIVNKKRSKVFMLEDLFVISWIKNYLLFHKLAEETDQCQNSQNI